MTTPGWKTVILITTPRPKKSRPPSNNKAFQRLTRVINSKPHKKNSPTSQKLKRVTRKKYKKQLVK